MIVSVDMSVFKPPLLHFRFQQIQRLAISKGFEWYYSGKTVLKKLDLEQYTDYLFSFNFDNKEMIFEQKLDIITYQELLKRLKALQ